MQKTALLAELTAICAQKKGEVVIYDLTQAVGAFLHAHNKEPTGSFYDQMVIERTERDNAIMEKQAQRLSQHQQAIRDEMQRRQEMYNSEDRYRLARRSMSENSPKHRASSSTEIDDSIGDRVYSSSCELHASSEELYFAFAGRRVRRGCCLGELAARISRKCYAFWRVHFLRAQNPKNSFK